MAESSIEGFTDSDSRARFPRVFLEFLRDVRGRNSIPDKVDGMWEAWEAVNAYCGSR